MLQATPPSTRLHQYLDELLENDEAWPSDGRGNLIRMDMGSLRDSISECLEDKISNTALAIAGVIDSMTTAPDLYKSGDLAATAKAFVEIHATQKWRPDLSPRRLLRKWAKKQRDPELAVRIMWYVSAVWVAQFQSPR